MEELRDIERKYKGTYVPLLIKGKKTTPVTALVENIQTVERTGEPTIMFHSVSKESVVNEQVNWGGIKSMAFKNVEILPLPYACMFDSGKFSWVFRRKPARQWRVGICQDNSVFVNPMETYLTYLSRALPTTRFSGIQKPHTSGNLINLFFNEVCPLNEAIALLLEGKYVSKTVTHKNAVSLSEEDNIFILWNMETPLCYFKPKGRTYKLIGKLFEQEIKDFFQRQGEQYDSE